MVSLSVNLCFLVCLFFHLHSTQVPEARSDVHKFKTRMLVPGVNLKTERNTLCKSHLLNEGVHDALHGGVYSLVAF